MTGTPAPGDAPGVGTAAGNRPAGQESRVSPDVTDPAPGGREPSRRTGRVPSWVRALDLVTLALVAAAVYIVFLGGIHTTVLGVRVLIKSPMRALRRAIVVAVVRHVFYPRPSLPERIAAGLRQVRPIWERWERRWPAALTIVPLALVTRVVVLVVGWVAVLTVGYPSGAPPFRTSPSEFVNLPVRWDAGWYLGLIVDGYHWPVRPGGQVNVAFFPAYPWLVRAAGLFQLDRGSLAAAAWVGTAVSVTLFALALWYVHRLALRVGTRESAAAALWLLATYPFALFYSVPYTESLFLLVTAGAFHHLSSQQYWRATAFAFVAGLSRPNGVVLALPLGLLVLEELRAAWRARSGSAAGPGLLPIVGRAWPRWLAVVSPGLGLLAYSLLCWWHTGDAFLWLEVQSVGWNRASAQVWPFLDEVHRMVVPTLEATWEWSPYDVFNLLATLLALLAVWPVSRRLGLPLAAYVAVSVLVPLAYGGLMSLGRFTSVLFPVFVWLGLALGPRGRQTTAIAFMAGQALLAVLFFTWRPLF